jgi:hypothetical protein
MQKINQLLLGFLNEYKRVLVFEGVYRSALGDTGLPLDAQSHRSSLASQSQFVDRLFADTERMLTDETQTESALEDILKKARTLLLE